MAWHGLAACSWQQVLWLHEVALTASSSTSAGVMPALMHWMCFRGMHSISLAATTAFALMTALSLRSWPTCNYSHHRGRSYNKW
jgi:hypothetical protein